MVEAAELLVQGNGAAKFKVQSNGVASSRFKAAELPVQSSRGKVKGEKWAMRVALEVNI